MFRIVKLFSAAILLFLLGTAAIQAEDAINLRHIGTWATGIFDEGACEITAYDAESYTLFITNADANRVDVVDISDPTSPTLDFSIDCDPYGDGINSVAVQNGIIAIAVEADPKQDPGVVVFLDLEGTVLRTVAVGALPDMVCFTPDGNYVLSANEGEPDDDYEVDPEGTVSVIDISDGVENATVATADFTSFNGQEETLRSQGIRIFGPNASVAQDFEPEYITIDSGSSTAYVTLQEANAIAVVDIATAAVTDVLPLGFKDHSQPGNELDVTNDDDEINITSWPVFGMYLPDAIASFEMDGTTYLVTANEGDSRDYDGFSEEERVADLDLDATAFPNAAELQQDENLGRLKITTTLGDTDGDGDYDVLYSYGARSFSIWSTDGQLVYDSGCEFEAHLAEINPDNFNSTNDENDSFDNRSDDKGPEPEGVVIGSMAGHTYAFVGLERMGGVMVYDVSDLENVQYAGYGTARDYSVEFDPDNATAEDMEAVVELGPEGLLFVPADQSPNEMPLLIVSNEVSGSTTIFTINQQVSVEDEGHSAVPSTFEMSPAWPNPFNPSTTLNITLPQRAKLDVTVHNVMGQQVAVLANGFHTAGRHNFSFDAGHLTSGIYFIRATIPGQSTLVRKVMLVR